MSNTETSKHFMSLLHNSTSKLYLFEMHSWLDKLQYIIIEIKQLIFVKDSFNIFKAFYFFTRHFCQQP